MMAKEQRILTEVIEQSEVGAFIESLIYHGYSQIALLFDWRTGRWEISWPDGKRADASEE